MAREILFKAKRIDNGEWVEGYVFDNGISENRRMFVGGLIITDHKGSGFDMYDVDLDFCEVDENTICQYTGLTDKNGNKIWENDVLEWGYSNIPSDYYDCVWLEDECAFAFKNGNDYTNPVDCYDEYSYHFCMKVIGNTFDNTELMNTTETIGYADNVGLMPAT